MKMVKGTRKTLLNYHVDVGIFITLALQARDVVWSK